MKTETNKTKRKPQLRTILKHFLHLYTLEDVKRQVNGELNEASTEHATYWFGNGELHILIDGSDEEITYELSNVRGFDELVRDL